MRELLLRLSRIGVLINVTNPLHVPQWRETQSAAVKAGVAVVPFGIQIPEQLETAFAAFARERVNALLVPPDILFVVYHRRLAELAASARLRPIYSNRFQVENAGLMSYGPDLRDNYRRAATLCREDSKGREAPQTCRLSSRPRPN